MVPLAAIGLVVLAIPTFGLAGSSQSPSALRAENARLESRSRSAVLELYSLDRRLVLARARVATLDRQMTSLRAERASLAHQLQVARQGDRIAQRQLGRRLRALYEQGYVEPLEIVLGARNLDEAISSLDSLSRMSAQGEQVVRELATARKLTEAAQASLAQREAEIAAAGAAARTTEASLASTQAQRRSYLAALATRHRLNDRQIAAFVAQAHAAVVQTAEITPAAAVTAPVTDVAAPTSFSGARSLTVSATAYSLPGFTASGLPVGWGVVAVDPSVIPMGTHMFVPGYGAAVAADRGTAIIGPRIDLWFPTLAQARAWGRRTVTIQIQ